jgi:hypothetical protein
VGKRDRSWTKVNCTRRRAFEGRAKSYYFGSPPPRISTLRLGGFVSRRPTIHTLPLSFSRAVFNHRNRSGSRFQSLSLSTRAACFFTEAACVLWCPPASKPSLVAHYTSLPSHPSDLGGAGSRPSYHRPRPLKRYT